MSMGLRDRIKAANTQAAAGMADVRAKAREDAADLRERSAAIDAKFREDMAQHRADNAAHNAQLREQFRTDMEAARAKHAGRGLFGRRKS